MGTESYNVYWPETIIFWGAGATASLGFHTTDGITKTIYSLVQDDSIEIRVKNAFGDDLPNEVRDNLVELFLILNDADNSNQKEAMKRQFKRLSESERNNRMSFLEKQYDWITLKKVNGNLPRCCK